jgi:hypothetical protein
VHATQVDDGGQVVDFLQDPDGRHVATVSAVSEEVTVGGGTRLWLGNLVGSYVSYVDLGPAAAAGGGGAAQAAWEDETRHNEL